MEELIAVIVDCSNKNAEAKRAENWEPVTPSEMKAFIAFLTICNDLVVPRDENFSFWC